MGRLRLHPEGHLVTRIGWLRAAVMPLLIVVVSSAGALVPLVSIARSVR